MTLDELRTSGRAFITVSEAVPDLFPVDERTLRRAIADGQVPGVKVGVKTLIPVPALLQLLGAERRTEDHQAAEPGSAVFPLHVGGHAA